MNSLYFFQKKKRKRHVYIHSFIYHYSILISWFDSFVIMWFCYIFFKRKEEKEEEDTYILNHKFCFFFKRKEEEEEDMYILNRKFW